MKIGDRAGEHGYWIEGGVCHGILVCARNNGKAPIELQCEACERIVCIPQPKLATIGSPPDAKPDDIPF